MKSVATIVFFIVIFCNCNRQTEEDKKFTLLTEALNKPLRHDYKSFLIIPAEGCSACIEWSKDFALSHLNNKEVAFIFSSPTEKRIKLLIGEENIRQENIYLDLNAKASAYGLIKNYSPVIIYAEKISKKTIQLKPENIQEELFKLEQYLQDN